VSHNFVPELLIIGSCVLFSVDQTIPAVAFLSIGLLSSLIRTSVVLQIAKEKNENVKRILGMIESAGSSFIELISSIEFTPQGPYGNRGGDDTDNYN